MHIHQTSAIHRLAAFRSGALALLLACCAALPQAARAVPADPAAMMGTVPGTDMSKDEFRARAYVQLATVALNAHAAYLAYGDFPADFYELYNSPAWNLDINNIFSGRTVDAIEFNPLPSEMTSAPVLGLQVFDIPQPGEDEPAPDIAQLMRSGQLGSGVQVDLNELTSAALSQGMQTDARRVNPLAITPKDPGSIYYYSKDGLLQLVMFAPDGQTYVEHVNEVPNRGWLDALSIKSEGGLSFPDDMFANQVLYYAERMLPRHYNLVRFMGSSKPLTETELRRCGAPERIQLAAELGVTMFNPFRQRAARVLAEPELGDFLAAAQPLPLVMVLKSGQPATFASLTRGEADLRTARTPGQAPAGRQPAAKPDKPRPTPPMGGRK